MGKLVGILGRFGGKEEGGGDDCRVGGLQGGSG